VKNVDGVKGNNEVGMGNVDAVKGSVDAVMGT
jgi:hypothetical protein